MTFFLPKVESKSLITEKSRLWKAHECILPKGIAASAFFKLWKQGYTGKGIKVAILDTGVEDHPDLQGRVVKHINLTGEKITESHGTHVAGIVGSNGRIIGGAFDAEIIDIQTIGKNGASYENIIRAIEIAIEQGANVINMSLGGCGIAPAQKRQLEAVIARAWNSGIVCFVANGNEGNSVGTIDVCEFPASIRLAKGVGACDIDKTLKNISLAQFSNENYSVKYVACGVDVLSCSLGGKYEVMSGTSQGTPYVAAFAALLCQVLKETTDYEGRVFSTALCALLGQHLFELKEINDIDNDPETNISFGAGYVRYNPEEELEVPGPEIFYHGIFVGYSV